MKWFNFLKRKKKPPVKVGRPCYAKIVVEIGHYSKMNLQPMHTTETFLIDPESIVQLFDVAEATKQIYETKQVRNNG